MNRQRFCKIPSIATSGNHECLCTILSYSIRQMLRCFTGKWNKWCLALKDEGNIFNKKKKSTFIPSCLSYSALKNDLLTPAPTSATFPWNSNHLSNKYCTYFLSQNTLLSHWAFADNVILCYCQVITLTAVFNFVSSPRCLIYRIKYHLVLNMASSVQ